MSVTIPSRMVRLKVMLLASLLFGSAAPGAERRKQLPVYLSFLIHCEASPIRGVPVDVQYEPYSGEGVLPRNQYLDEILDVCEEHGIKFEFAVTPFFAQQLREDRPDIIERIKRMKLPISRYPSIAGHVLPAPVGEIRHMPGMQLQQLRNREISWEQYLANEWIAETRTLVPRWRLDGDRVIVHNPRAGTPMKLEELPEYRIPKEDRRLYGGTLALQEIFGVTSLPTFPAIFKNDTTRFRPTPVQRALGMWSFETSTYPIQAFNAPIRASNPRMVDWFVRHFPVDRPLHADSGFGYTHDYQGSYVGLNVKAELIRYAVEHPKEYKIVWPDPEERQWASQNSPLAFYRRTYGVSSLREVRQMAPPIQKIQQIDPSVPIRRLTRSDSPARSGWQKEFLFTFSELGVTSESKLPDFLRPKTQWVKQDEIRAAARWIVENTGFHDGLGTLPREVKANGETWNLATAFTALADSLEHFALYDRLPAGLGLPEVLGPVDYPLEDIASAKQLDAPVDRLGPVPQDPYVNEVNLLQAAWETAEKVRKDQQIPGRIPIQISRGRRGNYSGRRSQVNAAEFLYLMAEEIVRMEKDGLPDEVPFRRVVIAPATESSDAASPAWIINHSWTSLEAASPVVRTVNRAEILEAAEYLMVAWTEGHLGHAEDIGGPPYGVKLGKQEIWSLNDAFQALVYALDEYSRTDKLPDEVTLVEVLGPVDYPMYELRNEPTYNVRMLRCGWQPYQIDTRDIPPLEWIIPQGLPGFNHGSYQAFVAADHVLAAVHEAAERLRRTGIVPGSVRIQLPPGRRSPRSIGSDTYINAAELLWAMAQLYRFLEVLKSADDVYLRSCRLIEDQLHFNIVGLSPVGFSRQTYRYRRDQFDWIEKVPVWRIQRTWAFP